MHSVNAESSEPEFAHLDAYIAAQLTQARTTLTAHIDTEAQLRSVTTAADATADQDGTAAARDWR